MCVKSSAMDGLSFIVLACSPPSGRARRRLIRMVLLRSHESSRASSSRSFDTSDISLQVDGSALYIAPCHFDANLSGRSRSVFYYQMLKERVHFVLGNTFVVFFVPPGALVSHARLAVFDRIRRARPITYRFPEKKTARSAFTAVNGCAARRGSPV